MPQSHPTQRAHRRPRRAAPVAAVSLLAVLSVSCGTTPGDAPTEPTPTGPTATQPDEEPTVTQPSTITGVLGGDPQLEGGCAWLDAEDGQRYEVLHPEGYRVEFEPVRLIGPNGEVVAEAGERLEVTGSVAEDRLSICQVGPIFQAEGIAPAGD